jgi:hypothetical protein
LTVVVQRFLLLACLRAAAMWEDRTIHA